MTSQTSPADNAQNPPTASVDIEAAAPTLSARAQSLEHRFRAWIAAHPALAAAAGAAAGAIVTQGLLSCARHRSAAAVLRRDADIELPRLASVPLLASVAAGASKLWKPKPRVVVPAPSAPIDDVVAPRLRTWGRRLVDGAEPARATLRHARGAAHRVRRDAGNATQLAYRDALQQVEKSAQQHPAVTVAAAAGLGFVLTLLLTRR